MRLKTRKYDVAHYLDSGEMISVYLDAAFESGDLSRIAEALGDVARARGMAKISKATGLACEQLYKTLSAEGKPELSMVLKVMAAFGGGLKSNFPPSAGSGARANPSRVVSKSGKPLKEIADDADFFHA
jgi:probable addiction module antidote protein